MTGKKEAVSKGNFRIQTREMERGGFPNVLFINTLLPSFSAKQQITYFPKCQYTNTKYIRSYYLLHMFMAAEMQEEPCAGRSLDGNQRKAEGTGEKSSADQLYQEPRMGSASV